MKKVIINADDFGITKGVSLGILDSMEQGIVTETTAMANGLYIEEALKEAEKRGINNIGIHLTLSWGKPILPKEEVSSIVDETGNFYRRIENVKKPNFVEVEKELRAQISKLLLLGLKPTHLDAHHHFFVINKELTDIVIKLAKEMNIPLRCVYSKDYEYYIEKGVKTTNNTSIDFYGDKTTKEFLIKLFEDADEDETLEIMCHPAYVDEDLIKATSYNTNRAKEFEVLTSSSMIEYIKNNDIKLIGFNEI
ncbi:carbohydrate deacetylase [Clostridium sp. 'White wine YQ']|uniref:carbohydrate deacetylase n=1 Tax=Clostridium sp. 'White wine YQ' TaxID=3027474 RepID=UPI002365BFAE|nr:carbohydrate deacetylase [Clostridium sp. 'White wine YQ']MDD7792739.1 carbohydrate deacetylase [Clostridium sp. 'White wine YQ']